MHCRTPLVFLTLATVAMSQAWGPFGHRQIADIAWTKLNRNAKVAVAKILMAGDIVNNRGKDQVFSVPNQEITDSFLEQTVRPVFAESANWCDAIKGGKSKLFEARIDADNANSPGVHPPATGTAGEDARCKTWHYYDKPIAADEHAHPSRESNAVRALVLRQDELERESRAGNMDMRNQAYCLYWISHIYGDLHQPLHCVSNFFVSPKGDDGGNGFGLHVPNPFRENSKWNLHGYWDAGVDHAIAADPKLGERASVTAVTSAWTNPNPFLPNPDDVANLEVVSWIDDGWKLAQAKVYKGVEQNGAPSKAYVDAHIELCKRQAILAGFRLAEYLNRTLGKERKA